MFFKRLDFDLVLFSRENGFSFTCVLFQKLWISFVLVCFEKSFHFALVLFSLKCKSSFCFVSLSANFIPFLTASLINADRDKRETHTHTEPWMPVSVLENGQALPIMLGKGKNIP